jgi:hypothetical protein
MKNLFLSTATLLMATLLAQPVGASETKTVDLAKVNERLSSVVAETTQPEDLVTGLFMRIDEQKTVLDAAEFRAKASLGGTIAHSPWDRENPSSIVFGIDSKAHRIGQARPYLGTQFTASGRTNTLKLVNYLAKITLDQEPTVPEGHETPAYQKLLEELMSVQDLDRTYAIFGELREELLAQDDLGRMKIDVLASLKNGKVETILVRLKFAADYSFFTMENIVVEARLSAAQTRFSLKFRNDYDRDFIEKLEETKAELQAFAAGENNALYEDLKRLITDAKAFLQKLIDEAV